MNIKEYLERNLPNVNFNILPQLFEEEGIELTEEIMEYLKTTPWNTNLTIFEQILEAGKDGQSDKALLYLNDDYFLDANEFEMRIDKSKSTIQSLDDLWTWCMTHNTRTVEDYETYYAIRHFANDIEIYIGNNKVSAPSIYRSEQTTDWVPDETSDWYIRNLPDSNYFYFNKTTIQYYYDN